MALYIKPHTHTHSVDSFHYGYSSKQCFKFLWFIPYERGKEKKLDFYLDMTVEIADFDH